MSKRKLSELSEDDVMVLNNELDLLVAKEVEKIYDNTVTINGDTIEIKRASATEFSAIKDKIEHQISSNRNLHKITIDNPDAKVVAQALGAYIKAFPHIKSLEILQCKNYEFLFSALKDIIGYGSLHHYSSSEHFLPLDEVIINNNFLTKVIGGRGDNSQFYDYLPHKEVANRIATNGDLVLRLANSFIKQFDKKDMLEQEISKPKFFFYQRADKELLEGLLLKLYEGEFYISIINNSQSTPQEHKNANVYINDICFIELSARGSQHISPKQNYLRQHDNTSINSKVQAVMTKVNEYIAQNYLKLMSICKVPQAFIKINENEVYIPQDILSHIFSFLGEDSLWANKKVIASKISVQNNCEYPRYYPVIKSEFTNNTGSATYEDVLGFVNHPPTTRENFTMESLERERLHEAENFSHLAELLGGENYAL